MLRMIRLTKRLCKPRIRPIKSRKAPRSLIRPERKKRRSEKESNLRKSLEKIALLLLYPEAMLLKL